MVGAPGIYAETSWLSATSEVIIVSNFAFSDGSMPGGRTKNKLKSRTGQSEYEEPVIGCLLCGVELPNFCEYACRSRSERGMSSEHTRRMKGILDE